MRVNRIAHAIHVLCTLALFVWSYRHCFFFQHPVSHLYFQLCIVTQAMIMCPWWIDRGGWSWRYLYPYRAPFVSAMLLVLLFIGTSALAYLSWELHQTPKLDLTSDLGGWYVLAVFSALYWSPLIFTWVMKED